MQLRDYLTFVRKWWWLLLIATVSAAGASYVYSLRIPPTYRAETTILVGQEQSGGTVNPSDTLSSSNLAQAYALLVTQPSILQATADAIKWGDSWQSLYFQVSAASVGDQLIRITATSSNPVQAKTIADELARQLLLQSPVSREQQQAEEDRDFITAQRALLRSQIEATQAKLAELNTEATLENDPDKLRDLNDRIASLQTKVDTWQKNYADLSALLNAGAGKYLAVLAPAQVPTTPISPDIRRNVLIAALVGLAIAASIAYLIDYLDNTIKSPDDVERQLHLATMGAITQIANMHNPDDALVTLKQPRSPISEAYRVLRTNLRFSGIEDPNGALLVTSAGPVEGKTTTAANLAITLAQGGKRVVLVDSDLRRPSIHKLFGLANNVGLSTLFLENAPRLEDALQPTSITGLRVLTSGQMPPNPAELLDSKRFNEIVSQLRADTDMVVLDSAPCLAVADASIIGSRCSGAVLVIETGKTRTEVAQRAVETLWRTNVKVVGTVLNKMSQRRAAGYYYYYYYSSEDAQPEKGKNGHVN